MRSRAAGLSAVLLMSVTACGSTGPAVKGVVAVPSGSGYVTVRTPEGIKLNGHEEAAACVGFGALGEAQPGALVTVYGATGDIVGTAALKIGQMVTQGGREYCVMPFETTLNTESDNYQAEFGNSGKVTVAPAGLGDVILNIG